MAKTIKNEMGDIGESYIVRYLGPKFILSADDYDSEKDGVYDNRLLVEVKTSTRNIKDQEFIFEISQFNKMTSVDLLFINEIPIHAKDGVQVYLVPNNKLLNIEWRIVDGKRQQFVIVKVSSLLPVFKIEQEPSVDRLVQLSDQISSFRRSLKATPAIVMPVSVDINSNSEYYTLELPSNDVETISKIFSAYYKDHQSAWKSSGKKLRIVEKGKLIAIIDSYNTLKSSGLRNLIEKPGFNSIWFPTYVMWQRGVLELYDNRFSTTKINKIPVKPMPAHL